MKALSTDGFDVCIAKHAKILSLVEHLPLAFKAARPLLFPEALAASAAAAGVAGAASAGAGAAAPAERKEKEYERGTAEDDQACRSLAHKWSKSGEQIGFRTGAEVCPACADCAYI